MAMAMMAGWEATGQAAGILEACSPTAARVHHEVYGKWKDSDPKAAAAWLRGSPGVSEQARERLQKIYSVPSGIPGF